MGERACHCHLKGLYHLKMKEPAPVVELQAAVDAIARDFCSTVVASIGDDVADLFAAERALIESWAPHRQREFASGRVCARQALEARGIAAVELLPDADGLPNWPAGSVGSISHSRGIVMAAVALEDDLSLIGLDLEKTNRLSEAAMRRVVHPLEECFVGGDQVNASILFSLKEAFYKAQFPRWRTTGNFHDLALRVDADAGRAEVLELAPRFAPELSGLNFRFRLVGDYVVSLCWLAA